MEPKRIKTVVISKDGQDALLHLEGEDAVIAPADQFEKIIPGGIYNMFKPGKVIDLFKVFPELNLLYPLEHQEAEAGRTEETSDNLTRNILETPDQRFDIYLSENGRKILEAILAVTFGNEIHLDVHDETKPIFSIGSVMIDELMELEEDNA